MTSQEIQELQQKTKDLIDERRRLAEAKEAANKTKIQALPLKNNIRWIWSQIQDGKSTPDSPNTTNQDVLDKLQKHDWEINSNKNLTNVLIFVIVVSIVWLVLQSFWILPGYKEDYIKTTYQQKADIEILKKDNEKLKSDNDDLKIEVKYLRERFDRYIDTNKPQSK